MINFEKISSGVTKEGNIWHSGQSSTISYLDDGNDIFYNIEDDSFWFKHRNIVIEFLLKNYSPGEFILDVGGGNGFVTKHLQDCGYKSVLLEPGIDGIRNAEQRGVKELINATLQNVKFENNSIPSIGMFDVLEHIENDKEILSEIFRILRNDGRLYLTIPAYKLLWSSEDVIAGHYRRYNLNNIKKRLYESGFNVEFSTNLFSFLVLPIFIFRTLPSVISRLMSNNKKAPEIKSHNKKNSFVEKLISKFLEYEISRLEKDKRIYFGSSIIIVAQKIKLN